jgi:DNA primase
MARIPPETIERIKQDIPVQRLVEARGVALKPHGHDLIGLCPLHDDHAPSLVVSPQKNLWHCLGACQTGGSVIDWVMKADRVSFRQAVELLCDELPHMRPASRSARRAPAASHASGPATSAAGEPDAELQQALAEAIAIYHATLKDSPAALAYLEKRGLGSMALIDHFQLGFANRTLGARLADKGQRHAARWRRQLQQLGIVRSSGHEHFAGSIIIPIVDDTGRVCEVYGRKIGSPRKGFSDHLYLPGPHRGVFNVQGLGQSEDVILCEALIDALTFWNAGFENVTASYGVEGFGPDHLQALQRAGVRRVLIAYDPDQAGNRAATTLASKLVLEGFDCLRICFPKGMDANDYARTVTPARRGLQLVINQAHWLGRGLAPARATMIPSAPPPPTDGAKPQEPTHDDTTAHAGDESKAAADAREAADEGKAAGDEGPPGSDVDAVFPLAAPPSADVATTAGEPGPKDADGAPSAPEVAIELDGDQIVMRFADRRWRMRGLGKNRSLAELRLNLLVSRPGSAQDKTQPSYFVDTLDLYSARQRITYIKQAAEELGVGEGLIKTDLGQVLLALEELQQKRLSEPPPKTQKTSLSAEEQRAALELLRDPQLLQRTVADFERCGLVGEGTNKLVAHLAVISRKLDDPLAVVIQSSSAAGKSSLMDAVLAFVPEEDQVKYSAMTGQSLFYMGQSNLCHKVLAIVEEEGAERASYPLKLLQSEKELSIASTGKDPQTGRLETQTYEVKGPVAIVLTTTAAEIDEELLNRCLVLTVDEEREQTRAIHKLQRDRQTLAGLLARKDAEAIRTLHQNAQRLLQPLLVANPYAQELTFLDDRTRTRRDHMKYLTLIRTIALLHQHQRPTRTVEHEGQTISYIEVTREDIALANRLAHEVLGRSLDELAPQTRRLLLCLDEMVRAICKTEGLQRRDVHVTRRQIREATGWTYDQLRVHLQRLVAYEYVLVHRGGRGQSFVYELLYDGQGQDGRPFLMQLLDPGRVDVPVDSHLGGQTATFGGTVGGHWGPNGGPVGGTQKSTNRQEEKPLPQTVGASVKRAVGSNGKSAIVVATDRLTSLAS